MYYSYKVGLPEHKLHCGLGCCVGYCGTRLVQNVKSKLFYSFFTDSRRLCADGEGLNEGCDSVLHVCVCVCVCVYGVCVWGVCVWGGEM